MSFNRTRIKDHINETNLYRSRVAFSLAVVLLLMLLLISRLVYLQVVEFEKYQLQSNKNRIQVEPIPPKRGLIFDRNGVLLAENRSVYTLEIIPEKSQNIDAVVAEISKIISISKVESERFYETYRGSRRFKSIVLKSGLSEKEVAVFSARRYLFPEASIEARLIRYYPFGEKLAHVLGYVGRINNFEAAKVDEENYRGTQHIGKIGLEKYYEDLLHGNVGFRETEKDAVGRVVRVVNQQPSVPGADLTLHLDVGLQLIAEQAMDGRRGAIVAIDPNNGGVLALVSTPGFDSNEFVQGISYKAFDALQYSPDKPLFNRALRGQYPPGSTIKPHIGLLGLQTKTVTPRFKIADPGWFELPNDEHRYREMAKNGHGKIDLIRSLTQSCDIYFYDLAYRLGIDQISTAMHQFGFGLKTGIDMTDELDALMPSREWKRQNRKQAWFPGETVIVGIGQGFWSATPLQLANATAVIANKDLKRYQVKLVDFIIKDNQKMIKKSVLAPLQVDGYDQKYLKIVREGMRRVNHSSQGTAKTAFAKAEYVSAGKTGTAQLVGIAQDSEYDEDNLAERLRDNAMYIGYAPFDSPRIAVAVVVENGGGGGSAAAPVARKIIDHYLLRSVYQKSE
jgi:penicillin-binding protein 2